MYTGSLSERPETERETDVRSYEACMTSEAEGSILDQDVYPD